MENRQVLQLDGQHVKACKVFQNHIKHCSICKTAKICIAKIRLENECSRIYQLLLAAKAAPWERSKPVNSSKKQLEKLHYKACIIFNKHYDRCQRCKEQSEMCQKGKRLYEDCRKLYDLKCGIK